MQNIYAQNASLLSLRFCLYYRGKTNRSKKNLTVRSSRTAL